MNAHKFWDSDLRRDPSLIDHAIDYARHYVGDFEFMVTAHELVAATGTLPPHVARAVLNCMLYDPNASVPPKPSRPLAAVPDPAPVSWRPSSIGGRLSDPEPRHRTWRLDLPAKVRATYAKSSRNGHVIHKIRDAKVRWELEEQSGTRKPRLYIELGCSASYSGMTNPILHDSYPSGEPPCRSGCWGVTCNGCHKRIQPFRTTLRPDLWEQPENCPLCGVKLPR